ncbi:MAG: glycosyltransferase family 2 protein [Anaerolineae bacterium]
MELARDSVYSPGESTAQTKGDILVSVIITTHNRARLLPRALHSVLDQTYSSLECIIVDDASSDETPDVVRQHQDSRISYYRHESNRGASAARNTGILQARGELIAFLDDDDEWLPTKLEKQVALMEASPDQVGVAYCTHYAVYPGANSRMEVLKPSTFVGNIYLKLLCGWGPATGSSALVKREVFQTCGLLDETLQSYTDYDLWLRVSQRYLFVCVPESLFTSI